MPRNAPDERLSAPHSLGVRECLTALDSDAERGLDLDDVGPRRARFGPNRLDDPPPPSRWRKLAAQFRDLLILILVGAAAISALMGEWIDGAVILAIVLLNTLLGYLQEAKAERALHALVGMTAPQARVVRGGEPQLVPAHELVPGDVVALEAGDSIPADVRLIATTEFQTQEAALTGESLPTSKSADVELPRETPLAERRNQAFMGSVASSGKARGLVTATGMRTELGTIAQLIGHATPEPTPLQRRLAGLGRVLIVVCLSLVALISALQMIQGRGVAEVFFLSVSLAVAAVPEGLPAIVTMSLALGLQRMVKRNAIIRKLPSVETLGSVTAICSDKTGTLTRNEMSVRVVCTPDGLYRVSGVGYAPDGGFRGRPLREHGGNDDRELDALLRDDTAAEPVDPRSTDDLTRALRVGLHCNGASLVEGTGDTPWRIVGDPTEGALIVLARKAGLDAAPAPPIAERPFDASRKRMTVVVDDGGDRVQYTKGAPEVIVPLCDRVLRAGRLESLDDTDRARFAALASELSARALRTLALAYREPAGDGIDEQRSVFAGLVGMIDPPREEVKDAVRTCRSAGIRPIMITGDHPATALAIGRELGIAQASDEAVTGAELAGWSDDELIERAQRTPVYARVSPEHKLRIVRALKANGEIVAMTGDGVNDAPALKYADIGIAMGITGTDVTKEAAAMVLTDDNFASIAAAVEEGRGIYDNIQKFVHYLLSCNSGELIFVLAATILGWPMPLLAIQILWLNLVTDGPPALALGLEPPEPDIMRRPPRAPREPVITWGRGSRIVAYGGLLALVTLVAFRVGLPTGEPLARTLAFATLGFAQLFFALSCRSQRYTLPELGPLTNPALLGALLISALLQFGAVNLPYVSDVIFRTVPLDPGQWGMVLGLALLPVSVIEIAKIAVSRAGGGAVGRAVNTRRERTSDR